MASRRASVAVRNVFGSRSTSARAWHGHDLWRCDGFAAQCALERLVYLLGVVAGREPGEGDLL